MDILIPIFKDKNKNKARITPSGFGYALQSLKKILSGWFKTGKIDLGYRELTGTIYLSEVPSSGTIFDITILRNTVGEFTYTDSSELSSTGARLSLKFSFDNIADYHGDKVFSSIMPPLCIEEGEIVASSYQARWNKSVTFTLHFINQSYLEEDTWTIPFTIRLYDYDGPLYNPV